MRNEKPGDCSSHPAIPKLRTEGRLRLLATGMLILSWASACGINVQDFQDFNDAPSLLPLLLLVTSFVLFTWCQLMARK